MHSCHVHVNGRNLQWMDKRAYHQLSKKYDYRCGNVTALYNIERRLYSTIATILLLDTVVGPQSKVQRPRLWPHRHLPQGVPHRTRLQSAPDNDSIWNIEFIITRFFARIFINHFQRHIKFFCICFSFNHKTATDRIFTKQTMYLFCVNVFVLINNYDCFYIQNTKQIFIDKFNLDWLYITYSTTFYIAAMRKCHSLVKIDRL